MGYTEPRIFRATLEAWLGQLLLPLAFFLVLTVTAFRFAGLSPLIGGLGLAVLALVAGVDFVIPMMRNWLQVDDCTLDGSLNGQDFRIYWNEVLAAWISVHQRRRYLCLGTKEGTVVLPMRFFDDCAVWAAVQERVPAAALEENALQRLPDVRRWVQSRAAARSGSANDDCSACSVSDHWLIQLGGWAGLMIFLFGLAGAVQGGQVTAGLLFLGLAAAMVFLLASWGFTDIDPKGLQRSTLFGGWQINWAEVREIDIDPLSLVVVLVLDDRHWVIPGPGLWNGIKKRAALDLIVEQAGARQIPLRRGMATWARLLGRRRAVR